MEIFAKWLGVTKSSLMPTKKNDNSKKREATEVENKEFVALQESKRQRGVPMQEQDIEKCRFTSRVPNTTFVVDSFRYQWTSPLQPVYCFLSHFHSGKICLTLNLDHYGGLRSSFTGTIYCTPETATLINKKLGVKEACIRPVAIGQIVTVAGVTVTILDANHCPGSCMFLFDVNEKRYLHTGDFRLVLLMCLADGYQFSFLFFFLFFFFGFEARTTPAPPASLLPTAFQLLPEY
jgi:hypothetical protein